MSIVSSQILEDRAQADGRRHVTEAHTDHMGGVHRVFWRASATADVSARMAARVPEIEAQLRDEELTRHLDRDAVPVLVHATGAQLLARLREAYREASRESLARLAQWVLNRITDGTVTEAQLRTAFGLTVTQWNALKARMQTLRDHWVAVQTAVGE